MNAFSIATQLSSIYSPHPTKRYAIQSTNFPLNWYMAKSCHAVCVSVCWLRRATQIRECNRPQFSPTQFYAKASGIGASILSALRCLVYYTKKRYSIHIVYGAYLLVRCYAMASSAHIQLAIGSLFASGRYWADCWFSEFLWTAFGVFIVSLVCFHFLVTFLLNAKFVTPHALEIDEWNGRNNIQYNPINTSD